MRTTPRYFLTAGASGEGRFSTGFSSRTRSRLAGSFASHFAPVLSKASLRPGSELRVLEQGRLTKLNAVRRQHGLYRFDARRVLLLPPARITEMASGGYFGHRSTDVSSFDRGIARFYPMTARHVCAVGENLLWSSRALTLPVYSICGCADLREREVR